MSGLSALLAAPPGAVDLRDRKLLLAHALGIAVDRLILLGPQDVPGDVQERFAALVARRAGGEPVSKIIGRKPFWNHDFLTSSAVLDPRPDTEVLVAEALKAPFGSVLDLGTGSGCILLSLMAASGATGMGVDISLPALEVARANAARMGLAPDLRLSDWFSNVEGRFDLIVSNPPYITQAEMADLAPEVRDHDPHIALTPGGDGLAPYRILAAQAAGYLAPGGRLLAEFGWRQGGQVRDIFAGHGWQGLRILTDLEGRDRVILAQIAP